jgi:2-keto-4-pentenoate hydratase/2-oxohepta-3-ene-1,7-dioic acid hydratase in catechol pathway
VSIKAPTPELLAKQKILTNILPVAAFFTALFTLFDVISSLRYMMGLLKNYNEKAKNLAGDKLYPYLWGKPTDRIFQHGSPTIIPVVFIVAWIIMMLYTHNFL